MIKMKKKKWDKIDQALWDCVVAGLRGFKNSGWLTLTEYENICDLMQKLIFKES